MDYQQINSERQFKDATGHSKDSFARLLIDFEITYDEKHGKTFEKYIEESLMEIPKLKTLGEGLFFVLFQLKNDLIWGSLGLVFGMAGSTAHNNFKFFSDLLELTLEKKGNAKKVF